MPKGYSGPPAINYLGYCEEAMSIAYRKLVISSTNLPALVRPLPRSLLHVSADAAFRPEVTSGAGNSTNIVASIDSYDVSAGLCREFGENMSSQLQQIYDEINDIIDTNLRLPQTCAQVKVITFKMKLIIPEIKNILDRATSLTGQQSIGMASIAGAGAGLAINVNSANVYRAENEFNLREQLQDLYDFAQAARNHAVALGAEADTHRPNLTATRTETTTNADGTSTTSTVADTTTRNNATTAINNLETTMGNI